ncbi:MAG: HEAT repeat domain-containing protein [Bdellovibrionales bacterium]|nr:HEAT repeat domain-containing protein [Bdellovibrionales bacterium]
MRQLFRVFWFLLVLISFTSKAEITYDQEHLEYWIRTAKSHPLELVRKNAAKMLGIMGDNRVLGGLVETLRDTSAEVRQEAVVSIGLLVDPRALPVLEQIVDRDPSPEVRRKARSAMALIEKRMEYEKSKRTDENSI